MYAFTSTGSLILLFERINVLSIKEVTSLLSLFNIKLLHIYCLNTFFGFIQTNFLYPPLPTSFGSEK